MLDSALAYSGLQESHNSQIRGFQAQENFGQLYFIKNFLGPEIPLFDEAEAILNKIQSVASFELNFALKSTLAYHIKN